MNVGRGALLALLVASAPVAAAQEHDARAENIRASQPITIGNQVYALDFIVERDAGWARFRGPGGFVGDLQELENPGMMLRLLADPQFEPLWPALLEWAGPGLERTAVRHLATSTWAVHDLAIRAL